MIYIAGPMTGYPEFNFPAFHAAATRWRSMGYHVTNPAENHGGRLDLAWEEYLATAIPQVIACEAVAVLPGWQASRGACLEVLVALALGKQIIDAESGAKLDVAIPLPTLRKLVPVRQGCVPGVDGCTDGCCASVDILTEAQSLVYGDRQATYGPPIEDFTRSGRMIGAILGIPDVAPEQVAQIMIAVKLSRLSETPGKRDTWVDIAGYADCGYRCVETQETARAN